MFYQRLESAIQSKKSNVCIGLDADKSKLPDHLPRTTEGVFEFNRSIINATAPHASAYKINTAFYEAMGAEGWAMLSALVDLIPKDCISIADAKRGDIGNTAQKYAEAFFETLSFNSVTLSPYMGFDSIEPFMNYADKGSIILGLTSNQGSSDFQKLVLQDGSTVYETVAKTVAKWHETYQNCLLVVGATHNEELYKIRDISPNMYFLVPGIGAQGGDLNTVLSAVGKRVLINVSRSVIYASQGINYATAAAEAAEKLQGQINSFFEGA